jgi:5'-3' exonuclease
MGIPSFYRQLCRRFPRIVQGGAATGAAWLCMDFNCAMYHVLRGMPPVASASSRVAWETSFCEAIVAYMRQIVDVAAPTTGVYVSCDGVVCAAKRRQQRLRRFKGPWFSATERAVKQGAGATAEEVAGSGWNQNALTPGSAFMAQLGAVLTAAGRRLAIERGLDVRVSTTDEPGEGEHKLLAHMRSVGGGGRCVIYGLDADLILLAMLLDSETGTEVTLLREAQEFESAGRSGEWRTLYVRELATALVGRPERVRDFVAAMSLLGNDFLPRSLTRTVRDDGIPALIGALERDVWSEGRSLVSDGSIRREALLALLRGWAATEEADMLRAVQGAVAVAQRRPRIGESPVETAMNAWQAQPAQWCTVGRLLASGSLRPDWQETVRGPFGAGPAEEYLAGLAWVWDYYSGRPVCQGWVYDHHLPPLWGDLVAALEKGGDGDGTGVGVAAPSVTWPTALPPQIHLLAVLPADSVEELLPPLVARRMGAAPWYWPTQWSLYDIGRSQMWECEPVIPLVPERILRGWCVDGS